MKIVKAQAGDLDVIKEITQTTIKAIYPKYYPAGAVDFFLAHHSDEHILSDVLEGHVYILEVEGASVGTVTVSNDNIHRLFVLPEYQHKGYGKALLDFAEKEILNTHEYVQIDASLPAKKLYIKRGYKEIEYNIIDTDNGDFLCYDVMRLEK